MISWWTKCFAISRLVNLLVSFRHHVFSYWVKLGNNKNTGCYSYWSQSQSIVSCHVTRWAGNMFCLSACVCWESPTSHIAQAFGLEHGILHGYTCLPITSVCKLTNGCNCIWQTIVTGAGDETLRFWNIFPSAKTPVSMVKPCVVVVIILIIIIIWALIPSICGWLW